MMRHPSRRMRSSRLSFLPLFVALGAYGVLAGTTVRDVGVVGEVAAGWALPTAPHVRVDTGADAGPIDALGPLVARRTRPVEALVVAGVEAPIALNAYTGGPPDWPARLVALSVGGGLRGHTAGVIAHVALGALLIVLAHRFLRFHAGFAAAGAAAAVLATDWSFVFYRKVLGGTEVLLQAAGLLVLWALWSRRWRGGTHGAVAIAAGVGLGLLAKATFAATGAAIAATAVLLRNDRPPTRPPPPIPWRTCAAVVALLVAPLGIAALHASRLHADTAVPSHDTLLLQAERLLQGLSGRRPAREGLANLVYFFGDPRAFLHAAYGGDPVPPLSALRLLGYGVTVAGASLAWRDRVRTAANGAPALVQSPSDALLRFLSVCVPLQLAALFLANRDLHHLAQAALPLALLVGLSAERVAGLFGPPRSIARATVCALFVSPHVLAGVHQLRGTDAVLERIEGSTFTEQGQAALVGMIDASGATRVVTSDYELYGMLEVRAPRLDVVHTWGAVARGASGADVLRAAAGGWFLSVRASAPMVYNWSPDAAKVRRAAAEARVRVEAVGELRDERGRPWATLWRVEEDDAPVLPSDDPVR